MSDVQKLPVSTAQKAFIIHDGAVLAVQKGDGDSYYAGLWDLPGGEPQAGESEIEALKRDVWETTGLIIAVGEPFAETEALHPPRKPDRRVQIEAYLAIADNPQSARPSEYTGTIKWITFDNLARTKFIPALKPLLDDFVSRFVDQGKN